jgi:uncharacterized damage-inducible protein DinB
MSIAQSLLPEFDAEMASTRKMLERFPAAQADFSPHAKSWPMDKLATHIANVPTWIGFTVTQDALDMAPGGVHLPQPETCTTAEALLAAFDANVVAARAALAATTDETILGNWSLLSNGQTFFTLPKLAVLRTFVMNHMIHHRGQLTMYYRLTDTPVPGLYGPSADEK